MADWSSLPADLVNRIAGCFLATEDLDYYMDFRAVCHNWRCATSDPKISPDLRFRPRRWIMLDEVFQSDTYLFVNTSTGRFLHKDLPLLRNRNHNYCFITSTTGGLLVMADRDPPHAALVLNPFTGYLIRFMAPVPSGELQVIASVIGSSPTLVLVCGVSPRKLYWADPDSECFREYEEIYTSSPFIRLAATGGVYAAGEHGSVAALVVDLANKIFDLVKSFAVDFSENCFLVESAGEMLIVIQLQQRMEVFKMDTERNVLEPVRSIGNRAIFLGDCRCLSVNADKFSSIDANCIYYKKESQDSSCDIYMYDLNDEKVERASGAINSINPNFLFGASPPFTIIQLLSSYTINVRPSQLAWEQIPDTIPGDFEDITDSDSEDITDSDSDSDDEFGW